MPASATPACPDTLRVISAAHALLRLGQAREAGGEPGAALGCYDAAIAHFDSISARTVETQRGLALAWMNRGNALQKQSTRSASSASVRAYDQTIALLAPLLPGAPTDHGLRNSLGAAHLNRAKSLLALDASATALESADDAIAALVRLPLDESCFYRANLAGAWLNRAAALLQMNQAGAQVAARAALKCAAPAEHVHLATAEAALGARCTLLTLAGQELSGLTDASGIAAAMSEMSELIDEGLALTRAWEARGLAAFQPVVTHLFQAGASLYSAWQPHFLAEFLHENRALVLASPAVTGEAVTRARRAACARSHVTEFAEPLSRTVTTLTALSHISGSS